MDYKHITFDNGVRLITVRTPEFKSVRIRVTVRGGSGIETPENNGISHMVEHMALEGTKNFPSQDELDDKIEYLGGGYNGYTSSTVVVFHVNLPDHKADFALNLLHDFCFNATFPLKGVRKQKKIISDEIHNDNTGPYKKFNRFWVRKRYQKGYRPLEVIGKSENVNQFKRKTLIEWYEKLFVPSNITITIVGNIDHDKMIKQVEDLFGSNHSKGESIPQYHQYKHTPFGIHTQVDSNEGQAIGSISFPSLTMLDHTYKDRQMAWIVSSSIAGYRTSVMYKKLRKDLGLIYDIDASQYFGSRSPGIMEISFTTSDEVIADVYKYCLEEMQKMKEDGITEKMVDHAIEKENNGLKMGYQSMEDIESWINGPLFWFNSVMTLEEAIEQRKSIRADEVNQMARQLLDFDMMSIISRVQKPETKEKLESIVKEALP